MTIAPFVHSIFGPTTFSPNRNTKYTTYYWCLICSRPSGIWLWILYMLIWLRKIAWKATNNGHRANISTFFINIKSKYMIMHLICNIPSATRHTHTPQTHFRHLLCDIVPGGNEFDAISLLWLIIMLKSCAISGGLSHFPERKNSFTTNNLLPRHRRQYLLFFISFVFITHITCHAYLDCKVNLNWTFDWLKNACVDEARQGMACDWMKIDILDISHIYATLYSEEAHSIDE